MGYKPNQDCVLAVLPFYHIYGQTIIMMSGLFCGAKLVVLPKFEPTSFMESIQKYRVRYRVYTACVCVPVHAFILYMYKHLSC